MNEGIANSVIDISLISWYSVVSDLSVFDSFGSDIFFFPF